VVGVVGRLHLSPISDHVRLDAPVRLVRAGELVGGHPPRRKGRNAAVGLDAPDADPLHHVGRVVQRPPQPPLTPGENDMMTMVSPVGIMLYDFDDESGAFTDYRNFEIPYFSFSGVCFSPSDRFLYVGNADNLYQVDLDSDRENPIIHDYGSIFTTDIDPVGWGIGVGNMVTGPDCRIYISAGGTTNFMHVIHNPEGEGEAAELEKYIPIPNLFFFDFPTTPNLFPHCDPNIAFDIKTSVLKPIETAYPMVVFPNPASAHTTINIDPNYAGQLFVYDMHGRLMLQDAIPQNTYKHQVDLFKWTAGMYLLRYESEQGVYVGKLLVER